MVLMMSCSPSYKLHLTNTTASKVTVVYRTQPPYGNARKRAHVHVRKKNIRPGKTKKLGIIFLAYSPTGFVTSLDSMVFTTKSDTLILGTKELIYGYIEMSGHGIHRKFSMDYQ
jgi:hypothetical protein